MIFFHLPCINDKYKALRVCVKKKLVFFIKKVAKYLQL